MVPGNNIEEVGSRRWVEVATSEWTAFFGGSAAGNKNIVQNIAIITHKNLFYKTEIVYKFIGILLKSIISISNDLP